MMMKSNSNKISVFEKQLREIKNRMALIDKNLLEEMIVSINYYEINFKKLLLGFVSLKREILNFTGNN